MTPEPWSLDSFGSQNASTTDPTSHFHCDAFCRPSSTLDWTLAIPSSLPNSPPGGCEASSFLNICCFPSLDSVLCPEILRNSVPFFILSLHFPISHARLLASSYHSIPLCTDHDWTPSLIEI